MVISSHIEDIKDRLRKDDFVSEASVSQGILLPTLNELGWPVFDTRIVIPEYSLEGRRVDFALCHPANKPSILVEVKKVGLLDGAEQQLFEYAYHIGVPMAILTDGQEWSFYLPGEQGRYDERRVYKLDILERSLEETINRLERYLSYRNVCSGKALEAARSDYKNVARGREIQATLPRAWSALLEEPDSLLLEILAEKVENLCGYKPDPDLCCRFLETSSKQSTVIPRTTPTKPRPQKHFPKQQTQKAVIQGIQKDPFSFEFNGKTYPARSARDMIEQVFKLLAKADPAFLEKFATLKHGKKRRYLAKNRQDLYPGRPDLAEVHSVEIAPGWWLGTHYSHRSFNNILTLAFEVIPPNIRSAIRLPKEPYSHQGREYQWGQV